MALAIDSQEASNLAHGLNGSTGSMTWSFNNVAGTLLLVGVVGTNTAGAITLGVPTYNGVTMTLVPSSTITWDTGNSVAAIYSLKLPATGSNTVSCSYSGGTTNLGLMAAAISFTGNDTTNPVGTAVTATGSGGAESVAVAGTASGNIIVNVAGSGSGFTTPISPTVLSALLNQGTNSGGNNFVLGRQPGSGTVTASWTATTDIWGIAAVEVKAAAAGGAVFSDSGGRFDASLAVRSGNERRRTIWSTRGGVFTPTQPLLRRSRIIIPPGAMRMPAPGPRLGAF